MSRSLVGKVIAGIFLFVAAMCLYACSPATVAATMTSRPIATIPFSPEKTQRLFTETPVPTLSLAFTITPTRSPRPVTFSPTPVQEIDAPAGILYCNSGLNYVNSEQQSIRFAPCGSKLSPNNRFAAYSSYTDIWYQDLLSGEVINLTRDQEAETERSVSRGVGVWGENNEEIFFYEAIDGGPDDIWSVNIKTGERHNLTNTPDQNEFDLQYWPSPDVLLFLSLKTDDFVPYGGQVAVVGRDGKGYQTLVGFSPVPPEVSPDGKTLALLGGSLYRWESGIEDLENSLNMEKIGLVWPAWSMDSQNLAWSVWDDRVMAGIGVINLDTGNSNFFHFYRSDMGEGYLGPPVWSPDGKWLSEEAVDVVDGASIWVFRADGQEEHYLGTGRSPIWSPDSQSIMYSNSSMDKAGIWLANINNWQAYRVNLPEYSEINKWITPSETTENWLEDVPFSEEESFTCEVTEAGADLNVREDATLSATVLQQLNPGDAFVTLQTSPRYKDRHRWWKIRTDAGTEGWIVENNAWYRVKE